MAGFRLVCLKPLMTAAMFIFFICASLLGDAQSSSSSTSAANQAGATEQSTIQAALQQSATSASSASTAISDTELEALPASGGQWEALVIDAPADAAQSNGALSLMNFAGQQSSDVSVDGISLRLAFGSMSPSSSGSPARSSTGQGKTEPSGMGQAWSSGRGVALSTAAIREVRVVSGDMDATDARSSRGQTRIETQSGGEALHGQVFLFNHRHIFGALNPTANWVQETSPATYSTVPVFTSVPYTPADLDLRWGFGLGNRIRHRSVYWFAALDGSNRNYAGVSRVK
jgi:hypothetical protein